MSLLVDQIFREANIHPNGVVKYEEFVKIVCAPVPDYYWSNSFMKVEQVANMD